MPEAITTCSKCSVQFAWNTDLSDRMPNCPKCGFDPQREFQASDIDGLLKMLRGRDKYASQKAAVKLGDRGDKRAVVPLINALYKDGVSGATGAAIVSLGKLQDERAIDPLISIFERGGNESAIATALMRIGSRRAVEVVAQGIGGVDHHDVYDVFNEFYKLGKAAVPFLVPMRSFRGQMIRQFANSTLERVGWKDGDPILCGRCGARAAERYCQTCPEGSTYKGVIILCEAAVTKDDRHRGVSPTQCPQCVWDERRKQAGKPWWRFW